MSEPAPAVDVVPDIIDMNVTERLQKLWNDGLIWVDTHTAEILISLGVATVIVFILVGLRRYGRHWYERNKSLETWQSVVGRTMAKTRTWFMIALALEIVAVFSDAPGLIARSIGFLFSIAMVIQSAIWARSIILGFVEHRTKTDENSSEALGSAMKLIRVLVTFGVVAIAGIVVLDNLNVDVTGLVAGLGIGGIAIGLAAQGIFADLFAALSIIFDKPFKVGDSINYDGTFATVEQIGLKSTRLRSVSGEEVIISNTNLLDKEIKNLTRLNRRRISLNVGVIYQTDAAKAQRIPDILRDIINGEGHRFVRSGFTGFGDSSLDYEIQFDVESADYEIVYNARHAVGVAIFQRFAEEGLEFAYPTQTTFTAAPDGEMILPYPEGGWGASGE
ncbi:mechanosensitive ion channel family protein [Parasphingopyxis algicola]|uniref:mechanosensitive ion channel family protein n=1 Tax=Parasphingopyxis algicola TaxID=2026624 RepID=UPI0015A3580E|nr:mechanosensitive ion channel family protein [Parasphingopyxis algicola]QLC26693.1 mechanosensitive ion channel family protein [Parasphingopyxis algicola]